MSARRWDLVVAAVEMACGIGVAAYFVVLGLTADGAPDRSGLDRALPFLLAALGLAVLGTMAWRSVRRARASRPRLQAMIVGAFLTLNVSVAPTLAHPVRRPRPPRSHRPRCRRTGGRS